MKTLYKSVKVVYDAHTLEYQVYYRNWVRWRFDRGYFVSNYMSPKSAREKAIERAESLLQTVEVFRKSRCLLCKHMESREE
jgi:hypothetical protein